MQSSAPRELHWEKELKSEDKIPVCALPQTNEEKQIAKWQRDCTPGQKPKLREIHECSRQAGRYPANFKGVVKPKPECVPFHNQTIGIVRKAEHGEHKEASTIRSAAN